jgi:DNA recombination protein RmuC
MDLTSLSVILIALAIGFVALFWFLNKKLTPEKEDDKSMLLLQNQMNEMNRTLDSHFKESSRILQKQFGSSATIIKDVTERLTRLDETNKQVVGFADQLKGLQDILKNPKQRGVLGEYYLETLLKNIFPPGVYKMQYAFKDGSIVDAVIFYQEKVIPVDSKFSLENYNRILEAQTDDERAKLEKAFSNDLKLRIDETSKYIKPEENTTDFAFMFIPAEAIYYDLLVNQVGSVKSNTRHLINYAHEKKVTIVSPTSFAAYLQTVLQGMRTEQIEESTKEIYKRVLVLARHIGAYEKYIQKMGGHLETTVNTYNLAYKELGKIDKDVLKIGGKAIGIKTEMLDKPKQDEGTLI